MKRHFLKTSYSEEKNKISQLSKNCFIVIGVFFSFLNFLKKKTFFSLFLDSFIPHLGISKNSPSQKEKKLACLVQNCFSSIFFKTRKENYESIRRILLVLYGELSDSDFENYSSFEIKKLFKKLVSYYEGSESFSSPENYLYVLYTQIVMLSAAGIFKPSFYGEKDSLNLDYKKLLKSLRHCSLTSILEAINVPQFFLMENLPVFFQGPFLYFLKNRISTAYKEKEIPSILPEVLSNFKNYMMYVSPKDNYLLDIILESSVDILEPLQNTKLSLWEHALFSRNTAMISKLVKRDDYNGCNLQKETVLMLAVKYNLVDIIPCIIELEKEEFLRRENINNQDVIDFVFLHVKLETNIKFILHLLLKKDKMFPIKIKHFKNAIDKGVSLEILNTLLSYSSQDIFSLEEMFSLAIISSKRKEYFFWIIDLFYNFKKLNEEHNKLGSLFHLVLFSNLPNLETFKKLVSLGGKTILKDMKGRTPLMISLKQGKYEESLYLGSLDEVKKTFNYQDNKGLTISHYFIFFTKKNKTLDVSHYLLTRLISCGMDISLENFTSKDTPLIFAMSMFNSLALVLLSKQKEIKEKINHKNLLGFTVLHYWAMGTGKEAVKEDIIKKLINLGADPKIKHPLLGNCLEIAQKFKNKKAIDFFKNYFL